MKLFFSPKKTNKIFVVISADCQYIRQKTLYKIEYHSLIDSNNGRYTMHRFIFDYNDHSITLVLREPDWKQVLWPSIIVCYSPRKELVTQVIWSEVSGSIEMLHTLV